MKSHFLFLDVGKDLGMVNFEFVNSSLGSRENVRDINNVTSKALNIMVSWSAVGEGLKKILLGDSILLILYLLERHLLGLKA